MKNIIWTIVIIFSVITFIFAKDTPEIAKIDDPRAGFLPGFHDTIVSIVDSVNNLVISTSKNLRISLYSFTGNKARYLTGVPRGIQVSYVNQLNNIDFESLIDYAQVNIFIKSLTISQSLCILYLVLFL